MTFDLGIIARARRNDPIGFPTGQSSTEYIIEDGGVTYKVHEFTESGTISFSGNSGIVECFILAGGGAGGFGSDGTSGSSGAAGGGGGAGGLLIESIQIKAGSTYSVVV